MKIEAAEKSYDTSVCFCFEDSAEYQALDENIKRCFDGTFLTAYYGAAGSGKDVVIIGCGRVLKERIRIKEAAAKALKLCREKKRFALNVNAAAIIDRFGRDSIGDIAEGFFLAAYQPISFAARKHEEEAFVVALSGIRESDRQQVNDLLKRQKAICEGILFAREMGNLPGNHLRPADFANHIIELVKDLNVEAVIFKRDELIKMGMTALLSVGDSSAELPCFLVLRYRGDPENERVLGLIGKGVTVDTGGYCLKPADAMSGIKGDMAGGAAAAGALYAIAKTNERTNLVVCIPMCENRISAGSLLPGDVISSYSGKTIEIIDTDAEGRLILADAVAYALEAEGVTEILDVATLTGAVVRTLGFTVAGAMCDDDRFYDRFEKACQISGERYWRLPFYDEHKKMMESEIADIKNSSSDGCKTITAGVFIRAFAKGKPWLHLDIAGTAWTQEPVFEFQTKGATGAGVSTIYYLAGGK